MSMTTNKNYLIADFNIVDGYESKKSNEKNTLTHLFSKYEMVRFRKFY